MTTVRWTRLVAVTLLAAGCGSNLANNDGGGGGASGSAGTTGAGGRAGSSASGVGGTSAAAGTTGGAGTTGAAGAGAAAGTTGAAGGGAGTTGAGGGAGRGGTTGTGGTTGAAGTVGNAGSTGSAGTGGVPAAGHRVFQGDALVLTSGPACTMEAGATSDRWCAFFAPNPTNNGLSLFVVNVTQASRGVTVACGAPDPNCLRLTNNYYAGDLLDPPDPYHGALFQGDTLVYYDATTGTPFAWRPGLTEARSLYTRTQSTGDLLLCIPASRGTAVLCLRDLPLQASPMMYIQSEVLAGRVDGTTTPLLQPVENVISVNINDPQYDRFSYGFPVPGTPRIAWSSRATPTGPEILKTQEIGNDATRVTVASDVHYWQVAPDGSRWYWMSGVADATLAGTLQSAPFPGGAGPTTILADTLEFGFATPTRLVTVNTAGALSVIPDPVAAPGTSTSLDTGVLGMLRLSSQGHVAYYKNYLDSLQVTDLYVKKSDGTGACTISATNNVDYRLAQFSPDAGGLLWGQIATGEHGMYTRTADCSVTTVANNIALLGAVGNRAVLFGDMFNATEVTYALQFRDVLAGNTLGAGSTLLAGSVGSQDVAGPGPGPLIYTVNAPIASAGSVFVRAFSP
jgi:hypothetical protein